MHEPTQPWAMAKLCLVKVSGSGSKVVELSHEECMCITVRTFQGETRFTAAATWGGVAGGGHQRERHLAVKVRSASGAKIVSRCKQ